MRTRIWIAVALITLASHAVARTRAVRSTPPPLDEYTLNAVSLEYGDSVDVKPGEQRLLRLYQWMCCWIPRQVTADARFSTDSGHHASLDPGGLLTIDADAPGGTSFRVYADIEHGRRIVSADVYVDTKKSNPLLGSWTQTGELPCDGSPERVPLNPITELVFRGGRTFSITWFPFELYKDYWGFYAFDQPPGHLTLGIRAGNYVPSVFEGDGTYTITSQGDGSQRLTMRGIFPGRLRSETGVEPACGAVFVSYQ